MIRRICILLTICASFAFFDDIEGPDGHDVLCVLDTHPLTVRTTDGTIFVRPWRSSDWRSLDDTEAYYGACD